jgi:hypothetical protein
MAMRAPAPPLPGQAARQAIAEYAADLVKGAYAEGRAPATPDPGRIAAAREREQAALDVADVVREIRTAAAAALGRVIDEHRQAVFAAIRAAFTEAITELTGHARKLPPGCDEQVALQQGGAIRVSYLAAMDLIIRCEALRELFRSVEDAEPGGYGDDLLELALTYLRTPLFYDSREDTSGTTRWGRYGTREFYLGACREADPGDWWLPTQDERDARAAGIVEQRRTAAVRASA